MLIAIGIMMIAYTGLSYVTTDKVFDLGAINKQRKESFYSMASY